ncbi:hypothetical protein FQN49_004094 [Arthroderma sp. PD_2]|nr:hypothetical protein FQN49_004094 [Arthroderma sp. PD_2]
MHIAIEFGYNNTAFLHEPFYMEKIGKNVRKLELFGATKAHKPLAFDAVLGVALYIFQKNAVDSATPVPGPRGGTESDKSAAAAFLECFLQYNDLVFRAEYDPARQVGVLLMPHNVHIHGRETRQDEILAIQPNLSKDEDVKKMKASFPIMSIATGVTYTLVDFTNSPNLLNLLEAGEPPTPELDTSWKLRAVDESTVHRHYGAVYFVQDEADFTEEPYITSLHVRVIQDGVEQTATAGACSILAAYLALQKGGNNSSHAFAIKQTTTTGRSSQLCLQIGLDENGTSVKRIVLSGRCTFISQGTLM